MDRRCTALSLAIVVGAALAAFATALHGSFVNWDDGWLVVGNPYLRSLRHAGAILDPTGDRALLGAEYLPLRDLSNLLDRQLFGLEPTGYRLGNWLLHGVAAGLAYALLREALGRPRAAFAGALLWAVHPLHAEVVAWASARKDLLNAVFALLAATLHLRGVRLRSPGLLAGAAAAFLLATLSKSSAAALPVMLALWDASTADRAIPLGRRIAAALGRAAPMLAVAAAGAALNASLQDREWIAAGWRGGGRLPNLALMAGVHLRYLARLVLPVGLSPVYSLDEAHPWAAGNLLGLAVLAAAVAGALFLLRRRAAAALPALWWLVLLLPVSNLVFPITNAEADRYLHLPSLGPCALAGLGLGALLAAPEPRPRIARGALAATALLLAVAAAAQARVWRDPVALWGRAVEVSPRSGRAWQNYSEALSLAGRNAEAESAIRRMLEAEPENLSLALYGGQRLFEIGGSARAFEAEEILRDAVARAPADAGGAHVALAWLVQERGRGAESVALLQEAARRQPGLAPARFNLGLFHLGEGRLARAAEELEEALRHGLPLDEEIRAHQCLFEIYSNLGDAGRAREHRRERERKRAFLEGE